MTALEGRKETNVDLKGIDPGEVPELRRACMNYGVRKIVLRWDGIHIRHERGEDTYCEDPQTILFLMFAWNLGLLWRCLGLRWTRAKVVIHTRRDED